MASDSESINLEEQFDVQGEGKKKIYICKYPDCGKEFRFKSEVVRHVPTHTNNRPFICSFENCGKSFKRSDALENHMRIHTKECPFICNHEGCGKTFPTKASLRYHVLKHKNDKVYRCTYPGCNKSFITLFQLKQHEKSVNIHKKIKKEEYEGEHGESIDGSQIRKQTFKETI